MKHIQRVISDNIRIRSLLILSVLALLLCLSVVFVSRVQLHSVEIRKSRLDTSAQLDAASKDFQFKTVTTIDELPVPAITAADEQQHGEGSFEETGGSRNPQRSAVVVLAFSKHNCYLCASLDLVLRNYLSLHEHPVLLLYDEQEYGEEQKRWLERCLLSKLLINRPDTFNFEFVSDISPETKIVPHISSVQLIEKARRLLMWKPIRLAAYPEGVDPSKVQFSLLHRRDYHHMCMFFFKRIFDDPIISRLDFYMRLDTDSYILRPVEVDPFVLLATGGGGGGGGNDETGSGRGKFVYGYATENIEDVIYAKGMHKYFSEFHSRAQQDAKLSKMVLPQVDGLPLSSPNFDPSTWNPPQYFNNFEVVHVPTMRHHEGIKAFTKGVLQLGTIYSARWGDAPLRTMAVRMFFEKDKQIHHFKDLSQFYWHFKPKECGAYSKIVGFDGHAAMLMDSCRASLSRGILDGTVMNFLMCFGTVSLTAIAVIALAVFALSLLGLWLAVPRRVLLKLMSLVVRSSSK